MMGGLIGLVVLVLDIIAIVNIVQSTMTTGKRCCGVIGGILPVIGMVLYF